MSIYRVSVFLISVLFLAGCGLAGPNTTEEPSKGDSVLKVSSKTDNPDSAIIPVEDKEVSEQYKIFSFTIEANGGSVTLRDLMVSVSASAPVSKLVHNAELVIADSEFSLDGGLADSGTNTNTMLRFSLDEKGDKNLSDGEAKAVRLFVRFNPAENFSNDATIKASFEQVALHKSVVVETTTGNKLGDDRKSGVAEGSTHTLRESGVYVRDVSTSTMTDTGTATFKVKLDVVAFDTDAYIRKATNRWTETASNRAHGGFAYFVRSQDGNTVTNGTAEASLSSSGLLRTGSDASAYRISEAESETITLTTKFEVGGDTPTEYYRVQPDAFQFAPTQADVDQGEWKSHALADTLHTQSIQLP